MSDWPIGLRGGEGPSSSAHRAESYRADPDGLDGEESADLSLDNALLADDPLAEEDSREP